MGWKRERESVCVGGGGVSEREEREKERLVATQHPGHRRRPTFVATTPSFSAQRCHNKSPYELNGRKSGEREEKGREE